MKSLNESIREVETKKRNLEENVDSLNLQITRMKTAKPIINVSISQLPGIVAGAVIPPNGRVVFEEWLDYKIQLHGA